MSRPRLPQNIRRYVVFLLALTLLVLVLDYLAFPYNAPVAGPSGNIGENGLWIRDTYYFGQQTDGDIHQLAQRLQDAQIRYAYFHVRFVERSGRLHFRYPEAANLVRTEVPGVRAIAWVYVGNQRGRTGVNLDDPAVRRQMAQEALWLTTVCGFDGVQWDYEVCEDNNQGLLRLLEETRATLPPGKTLSVATAVWMPPLIRCLGYGWSGEYFQQVAARCDQIAVMAYDTGIYLPRWYADFMARQVVLITHAARLGNLQCRVLIGVPTYEAGGPSHHARAENLANALRGVRDGLRRLPPADRATFAGVAPFADYTTSPEEWETYHRLWPQDTSPK